MPRDSLSEGLKPSDVYSDKSRDMPLQMSEAVRTESTDFRALLELETSEELRQAHDEMTLRL